MIQYKIVDASEVMLRLSKVMFGIAILLNKTNFSISYY